MKVLELLNQERVVAERRKMILSIEQRLAQGREETLLTQVSLTGCSEPPWTPVTLEFIKHDE